jgi:hypothetical protein
MFGDFFVGVVWGKFLPELFLRPIPKHFPKFISKLSPELFRSFPKAHPKISF